MKQIYQPLSKKFSSNENMNMDIIEEIKKAQFFFPSQHLETKRINSRASWWAGACGHLRLKKRQLLKKEKKKHFKEENWIKYKEIRAKDYANN